MSARPVATIAPGDCSTEIVSVAPVPPGWVAIWRDHAGATIHKPVAALAVVVYRWPAQTRAEPMQGVLPLVGWPDTGAFELADDAAFVGLLGPGETE